MQSVFEIGAQKLFTKTVMPEDVAAFDEGKVHDVYATFSLARDAEWSGRLFVLEMKEEHEEGIGTYLSIVHESPAMVGHVVQFEATLTAIKNNEVETTFKATCNGRTIATGVQKQKIVLKEKLNRLFDSLK